MTRLFLFIPIFTALYLSAGPAALAKIDLVTLPDRSAVQTTIYNSADLTLVRDQRMLTFKKGMNHLQFSWAGTRIDPTSLSLEIKKKEPETTINQISYPPRTREVGIWEIECEEACQMPVEITYFTSGITWQAFYTATLSPDCRTADIDGFVKVTNHSGETYDNAQTRLVVGTVRLLDHVADLAARSHPYGTPEMAGRGTELKGAYNLAMDALEAAPMPRIAAKSAPAASRPKQIEKKSLSEFFLYTIDGTETIPDNWAKQLPSFKARGVPVENLYKYDVNQYGPRVIRFLKFRNDAAHHLGATPMPGGRVNVYVQRAAAGDEQAGMLNFIGTDRTPYIPLNEKVELNLGPAQDIQVTPRTVDYKKTGFMFDKENRVIGFDEVRSVIVDVNNYSDRTAVVEIVTDTGTPYFDIKNSGVTCRYEKVDMDTVKYTLTLTPHSARSISYTLTVFQGERQWQH